MNIQSNINQTLSLAGLLWSQTSMAEEQKVKQAQQRKVKENKKAIEEFERMGDYGVIPETEAEAAVQLAIAEKGRNAYQEQFMLDPHTKTYNKYLYAEDWVKELEGERDRISRNDAKRRAASALEDEVGRIEESNALTNMYDLSKIDERARPRLERAIKRAERDTQYLTKKEAAK